MRKANDREKGGMRTIMCGALMALAMAKPPLGITTAGAQEDTSSANYMLPHCKAYVEKGTGAAPERGRCVGMVEGLAYALNLSTKDTFLCAEIPGGVTTEEKVRAVVRYIEARPQHLLLIESFKDMAFEALRSAWPCPKPPLSDRRIPG